MPTPDALATMHQETKHALTRQLQTLESLEDKAAHVFRFDTLLLGLAIAASSVITTSTPLHRPLPPWTLTLLATGLASLFISALAALWAYQTSRIHIGLHAESLAAATRDPALDQPTLHTEAILTYTDGLVDNAKDLQTTALGLQIATWALWIGILLLALATIGLWLFAPNLETTLHAR